MTKKFSLAVIVSTVIFFLWGFIFWGVMNGLGSMSALPNEDAITKTLQDNITASGVYYAPSIPDAGIDDAWIDRHMAGPIYMIKYHADGAVPMSPSIFVLGFLHYLVASFLMCLLLKMALPGLQTYANRLTFVLLTGVFASVYLGFSEPIWMYTPWTEAFAGLLYSAVGWLLAGAAIAKFISPQSATD